MQAVEHVTPAVAEDEPPPDAQESPSRRVVVQNGDVFVHQENVRRNGIQQLPKQDFVAHLCNRDTHDRSLASLRAGCQH
jgi:cold shock CspA family protein